MEINRNVIRHEVCRMGKSIKAVAGFLKLRGIRGKRRSFTTCPIANFLKREFDSKKVRVSLYLATVGDVQVQLPRAARNFITAFDNGEFKDLRK